MEQSTFEQMAQRWRKRAYETGLAYGATLDEADDIAQDTLLKLWAMRKELERYRSVEALAVVVARNQAIDLHRHRRTVSLDEVPEHLSLIERHAEAEMISREEVDWLQKRLAQLPPRQHTVQVMRQMEHRSYEEIASLLGIEATSAKALLSRARKWLLAQLTTENRLS